MSEHFPHAFSGFTLGRHELKNRLVALPAGTSMADDGIPTHADVDHFDRLAAGGVGMIVAGASIVDPSSWPRSGKLVAAFREEVVPAMADKAEVVHRHGALLVGQLAHLGRETIGSEYDVPALAAAASRTPRDAHPPHVASTDEVTAQLAWWGRSARHFDLAGLDGVEVHAAHGYLVAQFLSPTVNTRTDRYGGDLVGRLRYLDGVVDAMRAATRDDFLVGVRLTAEEEIPGGMGIESCLQVAEHLAARGDVDYLSITHGVRGAYVKDATNPDAVAVPSAARVREVSGLPVLVGQRIRDVATADHVVRTGKADLVGMARALIADPELPNKSRDGRVEQVRGCLGVNQDCRAFDPHLHCAVNAEVGRGRHPGLAAKVARGREVYVVGGGPAGLETARVAAERGHRVTLFERAGELGGAVRVAARSPHRSTLVDVVDYLSREARRLKVDVNLGAEIAVDDLTDVLGVADVLVLATGSRPGAVDVASAVPVLSVDDVLLGHGLPATPGTVVVHDESDGFWPAYSAAEALAAAGWDVRMTTAMAGLAARVPHESVGPLLRRLGSAGVRLDVAQRLTSEAGGWTLRPVFGGADEPVAPDLVVMHRDRVAVDELHRAAPDGVALVASPTARVLAVGDSVAPRRISHAIAEGYRLGAEI
ncbi:NAD(P)-binding protein [Aeromicrobium alkaliterrae]|uniref:FAD-dependent oxidoreductase n=1 Tax=Aeromicrobium alkaliterrae TaxID=302168 RepID=A0ABP4VEQ9_9ACTN